MELSWFPFSIGATLLFGVSMAFYKLPAAKNHNRFAAAFWSLLVPAALAFVFFNSYLPLTTPAMVWTAALWGLTFSSIVILQMFALHHVDTNVLFPVTTILSLIITVLVGIFFFGEYTTFFQTIGIILAAVTIFLFLYKGGKLQYSSLLVGVGLGIVFLSSFNKVLQKVVAEGFDIHAFQIYQYSFAALFALLTYLVLHRRDWREHIFLGGLRIGALIGVPSFLGGYSFYLALTKGPFPLITSIHSLYVLITALAAYFLFHETLTAKKIFLLFLAVISVIMIRLG